jgi:hypothetical protein
MRLTRLQGGVAGPCAVSRDGGWAVAIAAGEPEPTLVFVDLSTVVFQHRQVS